MKTTENNRHAVKEPGINLSVPPQDDEVLLPHERDEMPDPETLGSSAIVGPREVIHQAARDIRSGLRDTDLHGAPSNVPGPGAAPESTLGAEVPTDGPSAEGAQRKA